MLCRKDAPVFLVALTLGLMLAGCASTPVRRPPVRAQAEAQPPPSPPPPRITPTPTPAPMPPGPALTPEPTAVTSNSMPPLRQLHRAAAERYAAVDSYIVRLRRREQVNGKDKPEEVLLFKFRKQPWSLHFKWIGTEGAGREVVYVKGRYDDKIHTLLAAGDMPFAPAGKRIALAPDSLLVRSASRHAITEAGIGALIDHFGDMLEAAEKGEKRCGGIGYLAAVKRQEFPTPLEGAELTIPPGVEPLLPRGGRRTLLFDPVNRLPAVVITQDDRGHEVEYYCYDRFQFPVKLDDDDFNPEKLWKTPKPQPSRSAP